MRFDLLTIFPRFFASPLAESLIGDAAERGVLAFGVHDIRAFSTNKHRTVDDAPYGGGPGMVMAAPPLAACLDAVIADAPAEERRAVVYLSPAGRPLTDAYARELAALDRLVLVCGRYEGVDQRFIDARVNVELSIGDYVLAGGEAAALVVIEAVARFVPGVVGDAASTAADSFADGLLEHPHYTRPAVWEGRAVPEVLVSGHHAKVAAWRRAQSAARTAARRPDLPAARVPLETAGAKR